MPTRRARLRLAALAAVVAGSAGLVAGSAAPGGAGYGTAGYGAAGYGGAGRPAGSDRTSDLDRAPDLDRAVGDLAEALRRRDYPGAYTRLCPAGRRGTSAGALAGEFGRHPEPWRVEIWAASYRPGVRGYAHVRVLGADGGRVEYVFDVRFDPGYEGGQWRVCRIRRN